MNELRLSTILKHNKHFLTYAALIVYLLMHTGVVSDDFVDMLVSKNVTFASALIPPGNFVNCPVGHFTHHIWFYFFHLDNLLLVDLFKMAFTILSFYMTNTFFRIYLSQQNSLLVSFLFIFYPSHDAIPYWYAPSGHLLSVSVYLYSYYIADANRLIAAFALALVASFMVYGSTPIAVALFVLFVLDKQIKKAMIMIIPNIIYIIYFVYVSMIAAVAPSRVLEHVTITGLIKQFALQVATFADATLGPSMWLKLYYSFFQLSPLSWGIGILLLAVLYANYQARTDEYNAHLLISLVALMLCSFAMFAVTGRYPQLAFNLGNRTTFWGSLLLAYAIVLLPGPKFIKVVMFGVLLLADLGISDHWKSWNLHQQSVIKNVQANQDLRKIAGDTEIYVSGNQYSKFGPFSHIEFLSEDWVPRAIFELTLPQHLRVRTLNKRIRYVDGTLYDAKYHTTTDVSSYVNVYDSEKDQLLKMSVNEINSFIDALPDEKRHWIMLGNQGPVRWVREWAVFLMPRLKGSL